jgi:hypothetical protein
MSDLTTSSNEAKFSNAFGSEILQNGTVHLNLEQNFIVITSDKLEICLRDHLDRVNSKQGWMTPVSLFCSFIATLCAADFHDALKISSYTWQAIFIILTGVSVIWSAIQIVKSWKSDASLVSVMNAIKRVSKRDS